MANDRDSEALGRELADARAARGTSLKTVSSGAGISAAYLQKLERGQVESPSPRILLALSEQLDVKYERLMRLAGYAVPDSRAEPAGALGQRLASASLSQSEEQAVAAFVELLVSQRRKPPQVDA
jgi:transcriptional regulator with XRE-family HTH domain